MADIFYKLKEGLDDSDEAMEIDDVEKDDVDYNLSPNASETGICNVGGSGDEGERDELLLKLQQYVTSDTNFTRQRIGRILVETFRTAANNGTKLNVNDIMQLVQQIIQDPDTQVRLDLMEQLPHVATICQEAPHLFGDVLHDHLLNIIVTYLLDEENQVRMTTQAVVLTLMKNGLLDSTTIEVKICPVIEVLCRSSMDFLQSGISLMSKTAPLIGKRLTEKIFLDRYIALCKDKDIYVRKVCASHFGEICVSVGRKAFLRKLFPVFVDLCCDKAWGIRRACVHVMMPVACCMTLQERQLLLAELLAMHLDDESKWVRMSAFQILGPFISTFAKQFTEVTCNQHGELVFTSQQDTRFRYSYEGNYPPKYMVRGHSFDQEELDSKDNFNSSVIIRRSISDDEDDDDDDESQEDHIFALRAYKSKIQKRLNQNQSMDDTEKYNPFLYYYITPDLPLDDDLVEAAKKSSAKNNTDWKPMTDTASSKASSLDDVVDEDQFPEVELMIVNDEELVPLHLVKMFLTMAEPERYSDIGADILQHCAFSFPAVALTLGREHWHYLLPTYKQLLVADQWKVRRTLASSIHEIATILGEEQTAIHLVPVYHRFIKDVDEVRISALKHLAAFLKILKPIDRTPYLPKLKEFLVTDNEWNWRFREELAIQLLEIVNLFAPTQLERYIVPLSFELLNDKVAAVRHVALSLVAQIVAQSGSERMVSALFHELKYSLGVYAKKWTRRQTLVFVCAHLITNNAISGQKFSKEMLPTLLKLSMDKVPNVRLAVARTLSKNVIPMGPSWLGAEQTKKVEKRLREMRSDPDRDVRVLAGGDEKPVLNILSQTNAEQSRNILF